MRIVIIMAVLAVGCGSDSKPPAKPADPAPAIAATRDESCYAGTAKVTMNGAVVAELPTVARRVVDPVAGTITEDLSQVSERGAETFIVDMKVTGSKAEMKERNGAFTGTVELVGEPWKWNEWTSTSTLPNGMVVKATDKREGDAMRATKLVYQNDKLLVTMDDVLAKFDCGEFDAKRAALSTKK